MTSQLEYEEDSGPIEPDLNTYTDFDDLVEYCRDWKQTGKNLKSKLRDYLAHKNKTGMI